MGTDPVMTAMSFYRYGEVDRGRMAVQDEFVSYKFKTGEVIGSEARTIPNNKRVRREGEPPTSFTLPPMPFFFRSGVSGPPLRRYYYIYRGLVDTTDQNELPEAADSVD